MLTESRLTSAVLDFGSKVTNWVDRTRYAQVEHTYQLGADGAVEARPQSLDDAYRASRTQGAAQALCNDIAKVKELLQQAGAPANVDLRPGHIVMPEVDGSPAQSFEYHDGVATLKHGDSTTSTVWLSDDGAKIHRKQEYVRQASEEGFLSPDGAFHFQAGRQVHDPTGRYKQTVSDSFLLDAQGRIVMEPGTSLAQTSKMAEHRERGKRLQELLDCAGRWHTMAQTLDGHPGNSYTGSSGDVAPAAGEVIIPRIHRDELNHLLGPYETGFPKAPWLRWQSIERDPDHYGLQATPGETQVVGAGQWLTAKTDGRQGTLVLQEDVDISNSAFRQELSWSLDTGILHYTGSDRRGGTYKNTSNIL